MFWLHSAHTLYIQALYSSINNYHYRLFLGNAVLQDPYTGAPIFHKPYWNKISLLIHLSKHLAGVPNVLLVWMDDDIVVIDVLGETLIPLWNKLDQNKKSLAVNRDYESAGSLNTGVMALSLGHRNATIILEEVWRIFSLS